VCTRPQANQRFIRLRLDDQKELTQALTDIERALPPSDPIFAALKKDFAFRQARLPLHSLGCQPTKRVCVLVWQEAMAERFASSIDRNRGIVTEEFLKHSYTQNTCAHAQLMSQRLGLLLTSRVCRGRPQDGGLAEAGEGRER
jgi:hypothetical protein